MLRKIRCDLRELRCKLASVGIPDEDMRTLVRLALVVPFVVSSLGMAPAAFAQSSSGDKAAAEALFSEGRRLMEAGRYSDACPKFEASQRLDPGVGTMLNLAECYERTGRTASAWAEFREVISAARAADSADREALARQKASALENKLSRLTITLSPEASATHGIEVRRDGNVVDPAELGSAIPVDPGKHVIEATAPGKAKWFSTLELPADGSQSTLTIPPLEAATESARQPAVTDPNSTPPEPAKANNGSGQKVAAYVVGGVGIVGLGLGAVFGLQAMSKHDQLKTDCPTYPTCNTGDSHIKDLNSSAKSAATLSTVAFIVGGVGVAAGVTLLLTAGPSSSEKSTALVIGPGSVAWKGTF